MIRTSGQSVEWAILALDWSELVSGTLRIPLDRDEFDNPVGDMRAWTNVGVPGGHLLTSSDCQDWTSASSAEQGIDGNTSVTDERWTEQDLVPCDQLRRLYCFQQ